MILLNNLIANFLINNFKNQKQDKKAKKYKYRNILKQIRNLKPTIATLQ